MLRAADVTGTRWLETTHAGKVKIPEENAAAALEIMSRFAVDPRWLIYLPPTMSPAAAAARPEFLEHPEQAFEEYAAWGVTRVVCEEKHMGSRAIAVIARDPAAGSGGSASETAPRASSTRAPAGRSSATPPSSPAGRAAAAPLFESLETDWLALDCELLPWSAKAIDLIKAQYASVGAAARHALPAALAALDQAVARGLDVTALAGRTRQRLADAAAFRDAYAAYCRPADGLDVLDGITLAPFQVLACEGRALALTEFTRGTSPSWPSWTATSSPRPGTVSSIFLPNGSVLTPSTGGWN